MNDEIIDEVRAIKGAIGAKFNYDLRTLFEEIKRGEAECQAKGINMILPPANPESLPTSALCSAAKLGTASSITAILHDNARQGIVRPHEKDNKTLHDQKNWPVKLRRGTYEHSDNPGF
jgi:hypothetical protein